MNAKEILVDAKALIARPQGWTKGCLAREISTQNRTGYNNPWIPLSDMCFCAQGAIYRAARDLARDEEASEDTKEILQDQSMRALNAAIKSMDESARSVVSYNDRSDVQKDHILHAYDLAIEHIGDSHEAI